MEVSFKTGFERGRLSVELKLDYEEGQSVGLGGLIAEHRATDIKQKLAPATRGNEPRGRRGVLHHCGGCKKP